MTRAQTREHCEKGCSELAVRYLGAPTFDHECRVCGRLWGHVEWRMHVATTKLRAIGSRIRWIQTRNPFYESDDVREEALGVVDWFWWNVRVPSRLYGPVAPVTTDGTMKYQDVSGRWRQLPLTGGRVVRRRRKMPEVVCEFLPLELTCSDGYWPLIAAWDSVRAPLWVARQAKEEFFRALRPFGLRHVVPADGVATSAIVPMSWLVKFAEVFGGEQDDTIRAKLDELMGHDG